MATWNASDPWLNIPNTADSLMGVLHENIWTSTKEQLSVNGEKIHIKYCETTSGRLAQQHYGQTN